VQEVVSSNLTGPTIFDRGFQVAQMRSTEESGGELNTFRAYFWPAALATMIFIASSRAHVASPDVTDFDKVVHFSIFGLLGTLGARLRPGWSGAVIGLLVASGFGATDEWHQSYVPGREAGLDDWIADTLGAALAVSLYAGWAAYRRLLEMPIWNTRTGNSSTS
jgi:VanZ family protein